MNREDFAILTQGEPVPQIRAESFSGKPLTLLYGYTCDRATFHVYLKDGLIHRLVYKEGARTVDLVEHEALRSWDPNLLVPDKRVFPESTNILMATLLKDAGVLVPYTRFNEENYERVKDERMHAMTVEDFG